MNELLILVDENDRETGVMDKLSVHEMGLLHRAFSFFIFNAWRKLYWPRSHPGENSCWNGPKWILRSS